MEVDQIIWRFLAIVLGLTWVGAVSWLMATDGDTAAGVLTCLSGGGAVFCAIMSA